MQCTCGFSWYSIPLLQKCMFAGACRQNLALSGVCLHVTSRAVISFQRHQRRGPGADGRMGLPPSVVCVKWLLRDCEQGQLCQGKGREKTFNTPMLWWSRGACFRREITLLKPSQTMLYVLQ